MKILTLVAAYTTRPDISELRAMESADAYPRASLFAESLNSDLLDERFLEKRTGKRYDLYKKLPTAAAQLIEAYLIKNNYDAVISWSERLGFPFAVLLKMTGVGIPHVSIASWISKPKTSFVLKLGQSRIDKLILMSSMQYAVALERLRLPTTRVVLLKWPIDQLFWRPTAVATDMISTAGREMRDYGTLIQAMAGIDIKCHIAANAVAGKKDAWMADISNLDPAQYNITIGKKTYPELRAMYARSRFVVVPLYPTDTDNGTTTILEAMAMGKAVICTRVRGQADVIQEGITGMFVPPQDPRALREAIHYLWNNPEIAERMGRAGRKHIEQYHTLDAWVARVKSIVEEVIEERERRGRFVRHVPQPEKPNAIVP